MWVACVQAVLQMWKPCHCLYGDIVNDFGTESRVHLNPAEKRPAGYNRPARQPWLTSSEHPIFVCVVTTLKKTTKKKNFFKARTKYSLKQPLLEWRDFAALMRAGIKDFQKDWIWIFSKKKQKKSLQEMMLKNKIKKIG